MKEGRSPQGATVLDFDQSRYQNHRAQNMSYDFLKFYLGY